MEEPEVVIPEVMPAHHELGPSKYSSLFECPCYEGKKDGSPDAVRGTYSHLVVQANITGDMSLLEKNKKPDLVQQDDIATGEWGAGEIKALAGSHEIHSEDKIMFNPQLDNDLPVMKGVFGTVDAWFEDDNGFLHICDYKTFDRGEKDHTPQMSGYAVLICSHHPQYIGNTIYLHVIAGGIQKVITYMTNFQTAVSMVTSIICRALDPKREPCPGDCCRHCAKAVDCQGVSNVIETVQNKGVWNSLCMADKKVLVESLKKIIQNFDADFEKEIEEHKGELESPTSGVKWITVLKNPNRVCTSNADLAKALAKHNIGAAQFVNELCKVTRKNIVEALVKANPGMKSGKAEDIIDVYYAIPANGKKSKSYKRVA